MWQNPINFLFFLGILFWVPQLEIQKEDLEQDHQMLDFMTTHAVVQGASASHIPVGPLQLNAKTAAVENPKTPEECLFSQLQVASDAEALKKNQVIFSQSRVADRFQMETESGPVFVSSEGVTVALPPQVETLSTIPFVPPATALLWEKTWGVKEAETVEWILKSHKSGGTQLRCLKYGSEVLATGYLTAENKIAFTVSSPFTLSFAPPSVVIETLYSQISRSYLGCAFIVMMMATLGLAILTNSVLRARVSLNFEEVDIQALPWNTPKAAHEPESEYWIRRLGVTLSSVQYQNFAQLPSFYRYKWEDGLTFTGRKAFLVVHDRGISVIEMTARHHVKSTCHIEWTDLYCVYFTQWTSKQSWLDLVTRSGERYQLAVRAPDDLKALLKRWDATQILDDVKKAS